MCSCLLLIFFLFVFLVVVPPQVAIGAIGRFQVVPKFTLEGKPITSMRGIDDSSVLKLSPTTIMNISWSADHRIVDGATVAKFSKKWASYLEDPVKMMVELK